MSELDLLKSGDRKFIESLYRECYRSISSWVRKNSGTENEAEDVFQDALVTTYQKIGREDFKLNCKLSTFIFSVARNIWLDRLRNRGRHVYMDSSTMPEPPQLDAHILTEVVNDVEINMVYQRSFEKLTKDCQEILIHFFNGLSMKKIVKKMKFPNDNSARKKKFNCKSELIKLVESDPHYSELVEK